MSDERETQPARAIRAIADVLWPGQSVAVVDGAWWLAAHLPYVMVAARLASPRDAAGQHVELYFAGAEKLLAAPFDGALVDCAELLAGCARSLGAGEALPVLDARVHPRQLLAVLGVMGAERHRMLRAWRFTCRRAADDAEGVRVVAFGPEDDSWRAYFSAYLDTRLPPPEDEDLPAWMETATGKEGP